VFSAARSADPDHAANAIDAREELDLRELSAKSAAIPSTSTLTANRSLIILYSVAVFLYWAALYLYVPTLPTYVQSRSDNLAMVGVVLAQYGVWQGLVRFPLGIASDWIGRRKPFIMAGFVMAGAGALIMGRAAGVPGLLVGRAVTGLAASAWVPLVVIFSSLFPPDQSVRASSILMVAGSLGRALATLVNGSLNDIGGYSLAFNLAAVAAAMALIVVLFARETGHERRRRSVGEIGRLIARKDVHLPAILAAIAQYGSWAATFGFVPILARQLGASDVTLSIMMSLNIGVTVLGQLGATAMSNRTSATNLILFSFILLGVGLGIAAVAPSVAFLFLGQICLGLAQGVGYPVLMGITIRDVAESSRTTAMGLFQSVYAIGMFAGPALSGVIADALAGLAPGGASAGLRPMFALTAVACTVPGVIITRVLARETRA
jgi:MFS family permease